MFSICLLTLLAIGKRDKRDSLFPQYSMSLPHAARRLLLNCLSRFIGRTSLCDKLVACGMSDVCAELSHYARPASAVHKVYIYLHVLVNRDKNKSLAVAHVLRQHTVHSGLM